MIEAHVEGRPIPFSSSNFTNDASVYRGGGEVECEVAVYSDTFTDSPSLSGGSSSAFSSSESVSSSSRDSS